MTRMERQWARAVLALQSTALLRRLLRGHVDPCAAVGASRRQGNLKRLTYGVLVRRRRHP